MAADPRLTALPPFIPPTTSNSTATIQQRPHTKRAARWRFSKFENDCGEIVEQASIEEEAQVDNTGQWVPISPASMVSPDDFRKMEEEDEDDDDEYTTEESTDEPSEECEDDRCRGSQPPVWHCVDCDSSYCSDCWPLQGPHKPRKKGRDGMPHEKTNPQTVRRLAAILNPPRSVRELQQLHEDDESTKWFGVVRDAGGRPMFEDYGRYASLMSSISPLQSMGNRYPQIVSFIGTTNAGKSTLIKLLVNHDSEARDRNGDAAFPSPVVGSLTDDSVPTSGDVHLYADPATHMEQLPILFADCEGFEGGERIPLGSRTKKRAAWENFKRDTGSNVHVRSIEWAHLEEHRQREYAVTALYPRLLYTFSDCVVFVLRNPKTFQSAVLTKLLDWGVAALEKSINQPALPHCIVALNGTDPGVDEREWDISYATQSLLSSVKDALNTLQGVPRFRELADYWRGLGKQIFTVEDLILRYYSSFKVVRIPAKPRYMLINEQIDKLHNTIRVNCEESFKVKRRARMLTNADELHTYLQSGFDHFTQHLDIPFNFMKISLMRNPIPNDFGGHILQLCTTINQKQSDHHPGRVAWLFEKLSYMLASCVLLDCARYRKGQVDMLFTNYEKFFDYAMGEYLEMHYPCAYISPDGLRRCQLVRARHQVKGHQDDRGIISAGDYKAAFEADFIQEWKGQLRAAIRRIQRDFEYELEQHADEDENQPEARLALNLHQEYLSTFYQTVGPASSIISHSTCFSCLMDMPEHMLPCGHVLCTSCVKAYGKPSKTAVVLHCCPLHADDTKWGQPAIIRFKPAGAGARVLCLDGAGVRGIVQLEVLRAIEQLFGGYVDIQSFFDLIVGTGTGGMIGVALSLRDKTVDACIDQFKAVCELAFAPRLKGIPIVSTLVTAFGNGRKFKTKPLYSTLQTAFGVNDPLFTEKPIFRTNARVALTATSLTSQESILLANYRRPEDLLKAYTFERPHTPESEMKIWEAVAAGLANPAHFRPFDHNGCTYLDGGINAPNPAFIAERERRLLWPDLGDADIFLSLGSGQHRLHVLSKLSEHAKSNSNHQTTTAEATDEAKKTSISWKTKRIDDVLDTELAWLEFRDYAFKGRPETRLRRFIRLNPDLERDPPYSDDKSSIESLQLRVRKCLQLPHRMQALRNVAHRLIASSFYLELRSKSTAEKSEQVCTGLICCRFETGSVELMGLGKVLEERKLDDFEPYFLIKPDFESKDHISKIAIRHEVKRAMIRDGVFALPEVYIPLRDESQPTSISLFLDPHDGLEPDGFAISNMPRVLLGARKDVIRPKRPHTAASRMKSSASLRTMKTKPSTSSSSEPDAVSLNGTAERPKDSLSTSDESWQQATAGAEIPKPSMADILAQSQGSDSSRQRTNRFWTYIGNNHMAQHPELYSTDELAKFAANARYESSLGEHDSQEVSRLHKAKSARSLRSIQPPQIPEFEENDNFTQRIVEARQSFQAMKLPSPTAHSFKGAKSLEQTKPPIIQAAPVLVKHDFRRGRDSGSLESVIDSSLPTLSTVNKLEVWLEEQKILLTPITQETRSRSITEDVIQEESD